MIEHKDMFHGSDLEKVEAIYGIPKESIISFSANVNPLGISPLLRETLTGHLDAITRYPERDYKALRAAIASYCDTEPDYVIVGNGSTELISLFIETQQPKKAVILGPTYSEYEREIGIAGGSSVYYPLPEEQNFELDVREFCSFLNDSFDLLVICNPNNPTSSAITARKMRKILDTCIRHGIYVLIDETYAEFADDVTKISAVPLTASYSNLVVLRGTSKFFAAPGLRLGYGITGNKDVRKAIIARQNPWSTNSLAEIAGRIMFRDTDYIRATRSLISDERKRMTDILSGWGTVKVYPANANFLLFKILSDKVTAYDLFDHCIKKGLMIRNCASFPFLDESFVRFCFMDPEANDRLIESMGELLKP